MKASYPGQKGKVNVRVTLKSNPFLISSWYFKQKFQNPAVWRQEGSLGLSYSDYVVLPPAFITQHSVCSHTYLEIGPGDAAVHSNPGNNSKTKHVEGQKQEKMRKDYSHSNFYPFNSSIKGKCPGLKQHLFEHFSSSQWVCLHLGYFSRENNYVLPSLKTILSGFDSWNLFCLFYGNRHILAAPTLLLLELLWQE